MAQVKLELESKSDGELLQFAETHISAMTGNTLFATPIPSATAFQELYDSYDESLDKVELLRAQLEGAMAEKDQKRAELEDGLRSRAGYVQETTKGVEADILSSALPVRDPRTPTTELEAVEGLRATIGQNEGTVELTWDRVERSRGYIVEYRLTTVTTWTRHDPIASRARSTVSGLESGKTYAFRVRAFGPNDLMGPWSSETSKMAG